VAVGLSAITVEDNLRQLLARRLVRDGRVEEALAYFRTTATSASSRAPTMQRAAKSGRLAHARQGAVWPGARPWKARLARQHRAQGWYEAAVIARRQGMEIMGYEQGPDYAVYGGSYPGGAGPRHGYVWQRRQALAGQPAARAQADLPGPLVTEGERQRYAATEAKPYKRFHYRDIAADYVMKSADALPARSQAFAAVLCQG
jgi:hypothetical protein